VTAPGRNRNPSKHTAARAAPGRGPFSCAHAAISDGEWDLLEALWARC
jgi:hypothetical protein